MSAKKKVYQSLDLNGNIITGVGTPTANSDAATKQYVDESVGSPDATDVTFTPETNTFPDGTDNVDEALKHLFQSANSGKTSIAGAIGDPAQASDTFATLTGYITTAKTNLSTFINAAEGTSTNTNTLAELTTKVDNVRIFKQILKFTKEQNQTSTIDLKQYNGNYPTEDKILVLPYVRINDNTTTNVVAEFNNGDNSSFVYDTRYVEFVTVNEQQVAQLKNYYSYNGNFQSFGSGTLTTFTPLNLNDFISFKDFIVSGSTITITAIPKPQLLKANSDINISTVKDIQSALLASQLIGSNFSNFENLYPRLAVSFNSGIDWYGFVYDNNINDFQPILIDVESNAFDDNIYAHTNFALNELTIYDWAYIRGNSNTIRFAYLMKDLSYTQKINLNALSLDVIIDGSFVPVTSANATATVNTAYNANNGSVTLTYGQTDAYQINYLDKR